MRAIMAVLLVAAPLAGCTDIGGGASPDVMASFYPLEFLARRIAGDDVSVGVVVQPGTEPHDYEPTPGDLRRITEAKLLVVQGASFDAWLERAREEAPDAHLAVATEGLGLRDNPDEDEAEELPKDPHTWLDPVLFAEMSENVEAAMADAFPDHAAGFRTRGTQLREDLLALDREFAAGLASCEISVVVTNHAAFGYMAARYDFTMVAISGLEPEAEPTPETMRQVVEEARRHNVTVVFFEDLVSPVVAEAVAREVGAETRVLSPVEGVAPEEAAAGADYLTKMREDLQALRDGMRCT